MGFRDLIEGMHGRDPCILGGALAGADGLVVQEWQPAPPALDLPALCAEMAQLFKESGRIAAESGIGEAEELFVAGGKGTVLVARVTDDYLLMLVSDSAAIQGKCRFLLRQGARRAKEML